jgi:hypothetical protein
MAGAWVREREGIAAALAIGFLLNELTIKLVSK